MESIYYKFWDLPDSSTPQIYSVKKRDYPDHGLKMKPAHLQHEGATRQQGEQRKRTDHMSPCSKHNSGKENLRELVAWETRREQTQIPRDHSRLFPPKQEKFIQKMTVGLVFGFFFPTVNV